jgi:predicted nucleic acid-binding protein
MRLGKSIALASCDTLYSDDMQDGQRIAGVTIRNPFRKGDE